MQVYSQIRMDTKVSDIYAYTKSETDKRINLAMDGMCQIGRRCVEVAKSLPQGGSRAQYPAPYQYLGDTKPNYTDWTTNLRESIGWAVLRDGEEYQSEIGSVANARSYYADIRGEYSNGIYLLVMATGQSPNDGRAYAGYVQALGYDVLSSSQLEMEAIAQKTIEKFLANA